MPHSAKLQLKPAAPSFACFVMTQKDGTRLYGHCLTVQEKLSRTTVIKPPVPTPTDSTDETADVAAAWLTVGELLRDAKADCYAPRCLRLLTGIRRCQNA